MLSPQNLRTKHAFISMYKGSRTMAQLSKILTFSRGFEPWTFILGEKRKKGKGDRDKEREWDLTSPQI